VKGEAISILEMELRELKRVISARKWMAREIIVSRVVESEEDRENKRGIG